MNFINLTFLILNFKGESKRNQSGTSPAQKTSKSKVNIKSFENSCYQFYYIPVEIETKFSLIFFSKSNRFRIFCYNHSKNKIFSNLVYLMMIVSTFKLAMDTFIDNHSKEELHLILRLISKILSILINSFFTFVIIIRSIALGFIMKKKSFCRDYLNVINFLAVGGFYFGLFANSQSYAVILSVKLNFNENIFDYLTIFNFTFSQ